MRLADFDYNLPPELIAQEPAASRDGSRLMIVRTGKVSQENEASFIEHRRFPEILDYLQKGDVLVSNNTKVIPARLFGRKNKEGALIEVVLLRRLDLKCWEALVRPGKRVKQDTVLYFGDGELTARPLEVTPAGGRILEFRYEGVFEELLDKLGQVPLPPYIHNKEVDPRRYQTVYAQYPGSAAAPTAGLHFTPQLLEKVKEHGVEWVEVLLHVGLGTFRPVKTEDITQHRMHEEYYEISDEAASRINLALREKRRVIAVGTTATRTLESSSVKGRVLPGKGCTDIFIYPGYEFKVISGMLTNFHLPKSTLLMLVSALATRERILKAYEEAVREKYRFFSFGDAMLLI